MHLNYSDSINVFLSISEILSYTNDPSLRFSALIFMSPLLGSWVKGHTLLDHNVIIDEH